MRVDHRGRAVDPTVLIPFVRETQPETREALEGLFIDRMEQNEELFTRYMNDPDFQKVEGEHLLRQVYTQIREEQPAA